MRFSIALTLLTFFTFFDVRLFVRFILSLELALSTRSGSD